MDKERSQQFMQKVVGDVGTALAAGLVLVGQQTGLFKAMAGAGAMSADQLVAKTGVHARYVEEWLGAMVCNGYVDHDPQADTFTFPDEHALFLTDESTEYYLGGLFVGLPGLMAMVPRVVKAFEKGSGIAFTDFGEAFAGCTGANEPAGLRKPAHQVVVADDAAGGGEVASGWSRHRHRLRHRCGADYLGQVRIRTHGSKDWISMRVRSRLPRPMPSRRAWPREFDSCNAPAQSIEAGEGYDLISTFDVIHDLPRPGGGAQENS